MIYITPGPAAEISTVLQKQSEVGVGLVASRPRRERWQIAAEWLEIAQWSSRRAFRILPSLAAPYDPPSPTSRRVLPPDKYGRTYRQHLVCIRHYELCDVAFRQITLVLVDITVLACKVRRHS